MARFYGAVGYNEGTVETPSGSGVWKESIAEHHYFGKVIRNTGKIQEGEHLNSDISVQNSISILADAYANEHFFQIRYVRWSGTLWTVSEVEVKPPRLILRLGGVYNGETPTGPSNDP